jgi:hypothetical protein
MVTQLGKIGTIVSFIWLPFLFVLIFSFCLFGYQIQASKDQSNESLSPSFTVSTLLGSVIALSGSFFCFVAYAFSLVSFFSVDDQTGFPSFSRVSSSKIFQNQAAKHCSW